MAILQSVDGKFYEVSDDDLEKYEIPPERVNEVLAEAGLAGPGGPGAPGGPGGGGQSPQVVIHVSSGQPGGGVNQGPPPAGEAAGAQVQPYGRVRGRWWWYNYWANCWRNCWRNCY